MSWQPQVVEHTGQQFVGDEAEFLASEKKTHKRSGITIDASTIGADANGNKVLKKGTTMGRITATGLYRAYVNSHSDGSEVAVGFLPESINLRYGNGSCGMIIMGSVIADRCSGLDSAAKADLQGAFTFQ